MRPFIYTFLLLLLNLSYAWAQDLSGTWEGDIDGVYLKMVILKQGNIYIGYTYDTGGGHCVANFLGNFIDTTQQLTGEGQGFIEQTFGHVLCSFTLSYSSRPDGKYLTGTTRPKSKVLRLTAMGQPDPTELKQVSTTVDTTAYMRAWLQMHNRLVTVEQKRKPDSLHTMPNDQSPDRSLSTFNKKAFDDSISTVKVQRSADTLRTIITHADSIVITISDPEIVDGDTVTVFHNNEILVSRLFVSAHPYRIVVPLQPGVAIHEFVLVANNLGSIPPNTALLNIDAGKEHYQLKAASDLKKNAVIIFKRR